MLCDKASPSVGKMKKSKDKHTTLSPSSVERKKKEDVETKFNNNSRARYNAVDSSDTDYDYCLDLDNSTPGLISPSPLLWGSICEPPSTSSSGTNTEDDGEEENEQRDRCEEKGNDKNDNDDDGNDEEEEDKSIVDSTGKKICYWNDDDSSLSDLPSAGSSPGRNAAARRRSALRERLKHGPKRESEMDGKGPRSSSNKDINENEDGNSSDTDNTISINESNSKNKDNAKCVIPRTWLSAGFNLSPCGMGLVLNPPVDSELARLKSMQRSDSTANTMASNNNSNSNGNPAFSSSSGTSVKIKPPLPPYHCGAITALLSVVTALIYSGASIQGREVNCNSVRRKPFGSLSLQDRKKEFPTRLVDALSALLYVAAREVIEKREDVLNTLFCEQRKRKISKTISSKKSSSMKMERKVNDTKIVSLSQKKSGKKSSISQKNGDDVVVVNELDGLEGTSKEEEITGVDGSRNMDEEWDDIARGQEDHDDSNDEDMEDDSLEDKELMTRRRWRAKLCRVCRWEKGETAGEYKIPLDQLIDRDNELKIMVSLTNLDDIKSFVLSNLRTFMSPGGCALFLETIIHIHGIPIVTKMIRKSKRLSPNEKVSPLCACLCEERQRTKWIKLLQKRQQDPKATPLTQSKKLCVDDELPQGHECMGIEVLSLLLTGKVHSSLTGWDAHKLGIGLLSVDGDSTTGNGDSASRLKFPPKPIWIVRGDTCYSLLWKNDLKVPGSRSCSLVHEDADSLMLTHWNCWYGVSNKTEMRVVPSVRGKLNVLRPVLGNRSTIEKGMSHSMTTVELKVEENETNRPISVEEIDNTESHPEDERYYPKNYRRWRFRFNFAGDQEATSQKLPAWTAFFRLTERQKKIVEQKLSPRINMAIWSKWPGATVDKIVPQGVSPPVV